MLHEGLRRLEAVSLNSRERAGRENPRHPQLRLEHESGDSCTTEGHTAQSGIALPEE